METGDNLLKGLKSLQGKTVLLTGAAGGIGSLLAEKLFLKEGALLLLVDINMEKLKEMKAGLEGRTSASAGSQMGQSIHLFEADLTHEDSFNQLCEELSPHKIDVLINNAGIVYTGSFKEMDFNDFDQVININLKAAIRLTHYCLPELIQNKGFIVNVASGAGLAPIPGLCAYSTSKFGLVGFSEGLRAELKGTVGVSTICPAFVKTDIMKNRLVSGQQALEEKTEQQDKFDQLAHTTGADPGKIADIIIKSVKKRKGLVPLGFATHLMYTLRKFFPRFLDRLNASIYRDMVKKKYLK